MVDHFIPFYQDIMSVGIKGWNIQLPIHGYVYTCVYIHIRKDKEGVDEEDIVMATAATSSVLAVAMAIDGIYIYIYNTYVKDECY